MRNRSASRVLSMMLVAPVFLLGACSLLEATAGRSEDFGLALLNVGLVGVTGKSLYGPDIKPGPTCVQDLQAQWAAEPDLAFLTDEDLNAVLALRAEQSATCVARVATWYRENFGEREDG